MLLFDLKLSVCVCYSQCLARHSPQLCNIVCAFVNFLIYISGSTREGGTEKNLHAAWECDFL